MPEKFEPTPPRKSSVYRYDCSTEKGRHDTKTRVNLNNNLSAKITNPLAGIPREYLLDQVTRFSEHHGLAKYIPLMRKGALVAQNPAAFEDIYGPEALDKEEINALRNETEHKWRVPRLLYLTIITCSIGAAVQGWDQEGSNGANLSFPAQFGIGGQTDHDILLVGLINSAPYIGSALIGCWLSDPLNCHFGRRGTIFISAIFCLLTPIAGALTQNWQQLLVTRILLGVGMGIKASTVPIFAAENSPASIRGALVMSWQLWTAFGIFLGCSANLAVGQIGRISWRPARDLYAIKAQVEIEDEAIGDSTYVKRLIQLFTIPRVRRATLASFVVMIGQQLCGINLIAFYSSTVFKEAGTSDFSALLASWGFGLVNFIFAWPALWTIDTFGRRSLLLFTFPNMAWSLLAAGLCTLIPKGAGAHVGLVALFVYVFAIFYSPGEGPVPFTYSAEVFPLSHREVGMSWAVATCLFWAAVLSITFPKILAATGVLGAFCLYAGFNVTAFVMIFLWMPETKQRTLEELDYVFAVPTSVFIKYNSTKVVPWWFRRYILQRSGAVLEPLYHFDDATSSPSIIIVEDYLTDTSDTGATVDSKEYVGTPEAQVSAIASGADAITIFSRSEREAAAVRRYSWHGAGAHKHPAFEDEKLT
ncbi:major facilitator superfamily domain-containing protein [Annulohypoxylon truncatum]|uniref:major facilitator superfamily domain-containing protein n=1 Tax=Annulohypoxylon truncatum TaxID=327061 RepID=UPI002007F7E5|nr:major facilitator superfamily domain-containing protein [Annulohypoxylon truncatum]KAI1213678.1 major facilitator superfamily domain-containing protein [Annulohypoxylon truncatum]